MIDWRTLTRPDWIDAGVLHESDPAWTKPNRRDFVTRGCAVFDAGFEPPPGWVHVECDDELGWFDGDEQAAANVSERWALFAPSTGVIHVGSTEPHAEDALRVARLIEAVDPPECAGLRHFRVIVPIADAITAGLLGEDFTCGICGGDADHFDYCTANGKDNS